MSSSNESGVPKAKKDEVDHKSRVMKEVPPPAWNYIPREQLFDKDGMPQIDNLRKHLLKEGRLDPKDGMEIIQKAANILREEPNLLQLQDPITGTILTFCIFFYTTQFVETYMDNIMTWLNCLKLVENLVTPNIFFLEIMWIVDILEQKCASFSYRIKFASLIAFS